MKFFKSKFFWVSGVFFALVTYFVACTHDDQVLNIVTQKGNELFSKFVTTPPTIDGTIDAVWAETKILEGETEVPNAGNAMFAGYIGDKYSFKLRSLYDAQYIYFLAEVPDANKSVKSAPWYFNPTTKLWAQEPTAKTFNVNGSVSRDGWGEDKMAFLWNIEESTAKFASQTCYASCHIFSPYVDFSVSPPVAKANANNGNHYTNAANEKLDQWWLHPNRGFAFNNMDDNYQDWAGGPAVTNLVGGSGNGRHFDDLVVSGTSATWPNGPTYTADASQGSVNNRQSLKLDGTGTAVNVPMWIVPDASNLDFLLASDTLAGGKAKKVTGVSSTGVLSYDGGTIDPAIGTDYQRLGTGAYDGIGAKCFPGVIVSPVLKGRADIACVSVYTGSGWVYEFKRLLKTTDVLKQDIDFTFGKTDDQYKDQPFGMAIFNKSNYQHGIKPNLVLKFEK